VERAYRKLRFARLMQRPGCVLGGPAVAACGGDLSLPWLPPRVVRHAQATGCRIFGFALRLGQATQAVAAVEVPQLLERALLDRVARFLRPNRTGPCCEQRETDAHRRR
jgi:hypothetical protein